MVEAGKPVGERNNNEQRTLGTGAGGSGLYSDGKFSFYPSATALWQLDDRASLEMSWRWFAETVSRFNLDTPTLPDLCNLSSQRWPAGANCIARKEYPSRYVSYPVRRRMIESLEAGCGQHLLTGIELRRVDFDAAERMFRCEAKTKDGPLRIEAKALIHAGGGSDLLPSLRRSLGWAWRSAESKWGSGWSRRAKRSSFGATRFLTRNSSGPPLTVDTDGGRFAAAGTVKSSRRRFKGSCRCLAAPTVRRPGFRTWASTSASPTGVSPKLSGLRVSRRKVPQPA